jgi:hypothetical protein
MFHSLSINRLEIFRRLRIVLDIYLLDHHSEIIKSRGFQKIVKDYRWHLLLIDANLKLRRFYQVSQEIKN